MYAASARRHGPFPASRSSIDWLAQPFQGEFDVGRLQVAPALDPGLVSVLWVALEILIGGLSGHRALPGELLADEGVSRHGAGFLDLK